MLQQGMQKKKKPIRKSSEEILTARNKVTNSKEKRTKAGRPAKYPRTPDTKRMNIFVPPGLHKQLRQSSVDYDQSMNEIIIDILLANLDSYEGNNG